MEAHETTDIISTLVEIKDEMIVGRIELSNLERSIMGTDFVVRQHHETIWIILFCIVGIIMSILIIDKRMRANV